MITESAVVVAVDGDRITVEAAVKTTCNGCQAQSDCGTGAIAKAIAPKTQQLTLVSPIPVYVGDRVSIGMPEQGIVMASLLLYIVPLFAMVLSAIALHQWLPLTGAAADLMVLAGSAVTTLLTFWQVSGRLKKMNTGRFQPVILSREPVSAMTGLSD